MVYYGRIGNGLKQSLHDIEKKMEKFKEFISNTSDDRNIFILLLVTFFCVTNGLIHKHCVLRVSKPERYF